MIYCKYTYFLCRHCFWILIFALLNHVISVIKLKQILRLKIEISLQPTGRIHWLYNINTLNRNKLKFFQNYRYLYDYIKIIIKLLNMGDSSSISNSGTTSSFKCHYFLFILKKYLEINCESWIKLKLRMNHNKHFLIHFDIKNTESITILYLPWKGKFVKNFWRR